MNPNIPWSIDHNCINDATGREVARIAPRLHGSENRSLIAAAPELLAALETAAEWLKAAQADQPDDWEDPGLDAAVESARAAIAKAKGGAK